MLTEFALSCLPLETGHLFAARTGTSKMPWYHKAFLGMLFPEMLERPRLFQISLEPSCDAHDCHRIACKWQCQALWWL